MNPGSRNLLRPERRVRDLPRLLEHQVALLRAVEQGEMHAAAVDAEAIEEAIGVCGCQVGGSPQGQPIDELDC